MRKKVVFEMEPDEDGYPPFRFESVWATMKPDGSLVIDNIPFYATAATLDDIVEVTPEEGELQYKTTVQASGNSLIRVICFGGTDPADVRKQIEDLGCATELGRGLIAVNVPPEVKLTDVQALLQRGFEDGKWDYEEALLRQ